MACDCCNGFYGRCMSGADICRHCYNMKNIMINTRDQYKTANAIYKKSMEASGEPIRNLTRIEFPKYYLIDHIRKLEKMLGQDFPKLYEF